MHPAVLLGEHVSRYNFLLFWEKARVDIVEKQAAFALWEFLLYIGGCIYKGLSLMLFVSLSKEGLTFPIRTFPVPESNTC